MRGDPEHKTLRESQAGILLNNICIFSDLVKLCFNKIIFPGMFYLSYVLFTIVNHDFLKLPIHIIRTFIFAKLYTHSVIPPCFNIESLLKSPGVDEASQQAQALIQSRRSRSVYKDIRTSSLLYRWHD